MKREELIYWKNKYDKEEDLDNKRDEEELRKKFQENRFITKLYSRVSYTVLEDVFDILRGLI